MRRISRTTRSRFFFAVAAAPDEIGEALRSAVMMSATVHTEIACSWISCRKSVRLVNSPTRTAKSVLDEVRNFAASSGRGWLTNFTCGVLLHSRTAAIRERAERGVEDAVGRVQAPEVLRDEAESRERIADGLLERRRVRGNDGAAQRPCSP